jgi:hypothetical protein
MAILDNDPRLDSPSAEKCRRDPPVELRITPTGPAGGSPDPPATAPDDADRIDDSFISLGSV